MNEASPAKLALVAGMSIRELIDLRAETTPEAIFLVDPETGEHTSFAQLRERCIALAQLIAGRGIEPGMRVAYAMTNGPLSATAVLGIMYGGFHATAVNLVAGNDTISYVLEHSGARLVLVQEGTRELISRASASMQLPPEVVLLNDDTIGIEVNPGSLPAVQSNADGLLMYTSGTTGRPKGVVLSHANLIAGGMNAAIAHELSARDRAMCVLPLYHINGLCVTILGPLVSGGGVVVPPRFSVSGFWATMRRCGCTWFSVVPTQISYLLHRHSEHPDEHKDIPCLRFGRSASAPLSPDVHEAFEARFELPIIETMGLTETAAQILSNPLPPDVRKIGSPGVAVGNEVIIADEQQCEVARGTEGEVLVRGSNVLRCYLYNEEATRQALTQDGWLRTGDLGRMDNDGYVFITGRLKELIIKGGENIAPREVDEALYSHPDVVEAAAFACVCEQYGQRIEAGVAVSASSTVSEQDLLSLCHARIGPFKSPDRIHFMTELPKGPSGKIQRLQLQKLFGSG